MPSTFPVWGMLEKLAPTLLAGVPAIVKPASATAYLAEAAFRILIEANVVPKGALQLIVGPIGDLFDHLTGQDVVSFTGSASTAEKLQRHPVIARESVRFIAERDSLNAAVLGPDATPGTPEFDLFVREVVREMTVKAGQKCTAIRRAFVPAPVIDAAETALKKALAEIVVGDPRDETTHRWARSSASHSATTCARRSRNFRRSTHRLRRSEQAGRQGALYVASAAALRRSGQGHSESTTPRLSGPSRH